MPGSTPCSRREGELASSSFVKYHRIFGFFTRSSSRGIRIAIFTRHTVRLSFAHAHYGPKGRFPENLEKMAPLKQLAIIVFYHSSHSFTSDSIQMEFSISNSSAPGLISPLSPERNTQCTAHCLTQQREVVYSRHVIEIKWRPDARRELQLCSEAANPIAGEKVSRATLQLATSMCKWQDGPRRTTTLQ